jgi:hypothetical protein
MYSMSYFGTSCEQKICHFYFLCSSQISKIKIHDVKIMYGCKDTGCGYRITILHPRSQIAQILGPEKFKTLIRLWRDILILAYEF